jgi:hypothetical protein
MKTSEQGFFTSVSNSFRSNSLTASVMSPDFVQFWPGKKTSQGLNRPLSFVYTTSIHSQGDSDTMVLVSAPASNQGK